MSGDVDGGGEGDGVIIEQDQYQKFMPDIQG